MTYFPLTLIRSTHIQAPMKHLNARIPPEEEERFDEISRFCREQGYNLSQIVRLLLIRWYDTVKKQ